MGSGPRLVGNRLALAGTVLYFLEWVAIAVIPATGDPSLLGADPAAVVETYRGHAGAFRDSGPESVLVDFALGAMIVSVAIEIASFGPLAAAGRLADNRGDASATVALDAAGGLMFLLVFVPLGASVFAASLGMLGSSPRLLRSAPTEGTSETR